MPYLQQELRPAGARRPILAVVGYSSSGKTGLPALLTQLDQDRLDLILDEGFKHARLPRLEVYRPALGHAPLYPEDACILSVATDTPAAVRGIRALDLNRADRIAAFIHAAVLA